MTNSTLRQGRDYLWSDEIIYARRHGATAFFHWRNVMSNTKQEFCFYHACVSDDKQHQPCNTHFSAANQEHNPCSSPTLSRMHIQAALLHERAARYHREAAACHENNKIEDAKSSAESAVECSDKALKRSIVALQGSAKSGEAKIVTRLVNWHHIWPSTILPAMSCRPTV